MQLPVAFRALVKAQAGFVEQRQGVRKRRRLRVFDVAIAFHSDRGTAGLILLMDSRPGNILP
jgi:hypothetical protein